MTLEQIGKWCEARTELKRTRDDFYTTGRRTIHSVKFENGDSYEQEEEEISPNLKIVKIKLNGVIDYARQMVWCNFGWREVVEC